MGSERTDISSEMPPERGWWRTTSAGEQLWWDGARWQRWSPSPSSAPCEVPGAWGDADTEDESVGGDASPPT